MHPAFPANLPSTHQTSSAQPLEKVFLPEKQRRGQELLALYNSAYRSGNGLPSEKDLAYVKFVREEPPSDDRAKLIILDPTNPRVPKGHCLLQTATPQEMGEIAAMAQAYEQAHVERALLDLPQEIIDLILEKLPSTMQGILGARHTCRAFLHHKSVQLKYETVHAQLAQRKTAQLVQRLQALRTVGNRSQAFSRIVDDALSDQPGRPRLTGGYLAEVVLAALTEPDESAGPDEPIHMCRLHNRPHGPQIANDGITRLIDALAPHDQLKALAYETVWTGLSARWIPAIAYRRTAYRHFANLIRSGGGPAHLQVEAFGGLVHTIRDILRNVPDDKVIQEMEHWIDFEGQLSDAKQAKKMASHAASWWRGVCGSYRQTPHVRESARRLGMKMEAMFQRHQMTTYRRSGIEVPIRRGPWHEGA